MSEAALSDVCKAITDGYSASNYHGGARKQVRALIQDSTFICNTRCVFDAYHAATKTYKMAFQPFPFGLTVHSTDLLPTFWYDGAPMRQLIEQKLCKTAVAGILMGWIEWRAPRFQRYLASFAIAGDPNTRARRSSCVEPGHGRIAAPSSSHARPERRENRQ